MNTAFLALMHFFVDFICAWAMFGCFREESGGYQSLLIYNFCAFALQMPLGTLLDLLCSAVSEKKRRYLPLLWAITGAALTAVGALVSPVLLGFGNALFHVGGGMDVIAEDFERSLKGRDLGIFVAPGAIGLYLGTRIGKNSFDMVTLILSSAVIILLAAMLFWWKGRILRFAAVQPERPGDHVWLLGLCCFAVVILRSYVGLSVSFSWKSEAIFGLLAVGAVALGKMAGGVLGARFGSGRTVRFSLLLAAACFLLGEIPIFGIAALFFFNMSMPVTLYMLAKALPRLPGFSFGLLTFGLFLGFLPVYAGTGLHLTGAVLGAAGSVLSVLLLAVGERAVRKSRVSS